MVATPDRVGFVLNEFRSAVATDATVKTKYGDAARDTKTDPITTYFDSVEDAQAMDDERLALLSPDRRRFRQDLAGILSFTGPLDYSQATPTVRVIDEERMADHRAAVVEIGIDFAANRTTIASWGGQGALLGTGGDPLTFADTELEVD
jgi:hypothetical protein